MKKLFSVIWNFFVDVLQSFSNSKDGKSARKLTAFALMVCVAYIHYKFVNFENAVEVLLIDLGAVLLLLSVVTVQNLVELRMGYNKKEPEKTEEK
jgi:hypothetical protein